MDAGGYGAQVRDHQGGGAVAARDHAAGQDDVALQIPAVALEDLRPEDQLYVALLVFDGDEHSALLPLGVLAGDGQPATSVSAPSSSPQTAVAGNTPRPS